MPVILNLVNTVLPLVIGLWKQIRTQDPNAATFTDAQVIEMFMSDAAAIKAKADAWLAAHPAHTEPPTP